MVDSRLKSEELRKKKKRKLREYEGKERDRKTARIDFPVEKETEGEGEEEKHEQGETNQKSQGGPWKNLDLILSLQSKESDIQRKIELAFRFVNSKVSEEEDDTNEAVDVISGSRLVIFLNDWIQSLLTSSDKRIIVEGKELGSRVMEACLDFRCWVVFKFCLEESTNHNLSLSFSPNLLRAMSCIVKDALSTVDSALQHGEELVLIGEGLQLYTVVADCVTLLFSSHGRVFNANVDLWASMVMLVLELVYKIYSYNLDIGNATFLILRLSCLLLEPFTNLLRVHPSPKNVFPMIVGRLLEPLLSFLTILYLQTKGASSAVTGNLLKIAEDILLNGLFHPAHIDGFLSTHTAEKYIRCHDRKGKDTKMVIKSYHRHFFQKVEKIMGEKNVSVLGGVGELFRLFVTRVKKQKRASVLSESTEKMTKTMIAKQLEGRDNTSSTSNLSARNRDRVSEKANFSSSLDIETCKSLFDLFAQFMEYLLLDLKKYSETEMEEETTLLDIHCCLKCSNKVVASFMWEKIYIQTEDTTEGAHLTFLKLLYDTIMSFSSKMHLLWLLELKRGEERHKEMLPSIAKEIIVAVGLFLEIEYKVVDNDLVSLWLMMLSFLAIEQSRCDTAGKNVLTSEILRLGCQLINIYSELRQVNVAIFALLESVRLFGFCDEDNQKNYSRFVSAPLPFEACVRSVTILVCSPDFRLAISSAIKSKPEGQVSGCIQMLKTDIPLSLEWMKVTSLKDSAGVYGKTNLRSNSMLVLNLQAELLGRALSEVYTIILDSSTVTARNSIVVGSSVKDLMTEICPTLGCLVGEQNGSVNEVLFSVTGRRFNNHKVPDCENNLTTRGTISAWILIFFFRLYVSCRSLYQQSISLMPLDSSRKALSSMGDLFATYSGKDWMEKTDWSDDGYFSLIVKPSASLLTTIQSVSKVCLQNVTECPPLVYVLHTMSFQMIVDLNKQIKALEFLQERVVRLVQLEMDDAGLRVYRKEKKKWKRKISILKKEAADLTSFMMTYLPSIAKQETSVSADATFEGKDACDAHENEAWDFCVSSVDEKSLHTALWWSLCQNTDIWCSHASKKELKKFLSLLLYNYLYSMRSSLGDIKKLNMDESYETGYQRKVAVHQISLKLLSDTVLYEETFLCRHLRSTFCHILEESIAPLFWDSLPKGVNFSAIPNWPEVLGLLEEKSMLVLKGTDVARGVSTMEKQDSVPSNLPPMGSLKGPEALRTAGMELEACQSLINFLSWMSKSYSNSRSCLIYATYILNLERLVVFGLLDFHGEIYTLNHNELFRLFVSCRRALKYLMMACSEEKMEVGQSSVISVLFESSGSLLWLIKSVSTVVGLSITGSEVCGGPVKDMVFSLMDHTSYVFLMITKEHFRLAIHSLIYNESLCVEFLDSGKLCKEDNLVGSDPRFDFSGHVNAWKSVVLMADSLKEQTQSFLESLKNLHCNANSEPGVDIVNLNELSSIISCFQGFLWGLATVLNDVFKKCSTVNTKSLIRKLVHIPELSSCISVFEDFILFFLHVLLFENGWQIESSCEVKILTKFNRNNGLTFKEPCCSLHKYSGDGLMNPGKQEENIEGGKHDLALDTDNYHGSAMSSGVNGVKNFGVCKENLLSENSECTGDNMLTEVDSFELKNLNKDLMQSLLKGEHPEVAFSVRQLFVAASAILGLQLRINCSPLSSALIPIFVGISQFLLMEFSNMIEMPHSFSFIWLDGVLKYLEVLGGYFSSTNPTSSRSAYAQLIDIHLRAIGKCISLQGKGATLQFHERELGKETVQGEIGSFASPFCHGVYSLGEFKARLRMSFTVFIREPLELHLLSAVQAIERALVGVQEGCNISYEINTGHSDGGKVSSVVAAAVDCLDLVLESVSGRKRLNVVKRHIQSLISALFNIIVHLQSPQIFCVKLNGDNRDSDPDPGSVILMCVQVLTKVAGKHALFQMDSSHVGQALHVPAMLFKDFCQLRASQATSNPLIFAKQETRPVAGTDSYVVDQKFSVELFSACCRLLCTVVRHHKSETERCVVLIEDSVSVLLHCLEMVDIDLMARKGYFALDVQQGVNCASFLRRIYEEIRQQKDILGRYCFQFLSNYIWIYSGYGPRKTGFKREIDEALRPGVYALVDACSSDDLQQIHTVLGEGPCRSTLATLQHDYKLNFQYGGKV
ncbi:hypothetical protein NE237_018892 [Protea cynaroides]|uniref:Nucleolar 27S pre-rRNA processing Urb2/Npa2 C-terminal domain-containing protein n=1 Tax=Protea cynaroides TaxID=273540 RepID=A0A9Q0KAP3_9MAGN|nr:hypothetical protein NE237_018892 [Protea cynaroides]